MFDTETNGGLALICGDVANVATSMGFEPFEVYGSKNCWLLYCYQSAG